MPKAVDWGPVQWDWENSILPVPAIAERHGVNEHQVYRHAKIEGWARHQGRGRKQFDWEAIEAEYRAGVKTLREIADAFGLTEAAIRKRAKKEDWVRDLSVKIKVRTDSELVRREVRNVPNEREIIKAASTLRADISEAQRARISRLSELSDKITERLKELRLDQIQTFSDAMPAVSVLEKAARAAAQLIALERQAWNMDPVGSGDTRAEIAQMTDIELEAFVKARISYGNP